MICLTFARPYSSGRRTNQLYGHRQIFAEWVGTVLSTTAAGGTFRSPVFVQYSHVSAYLRGCILSCLPDSSADGSLTDQVQTLDYRAETLMKDVLKRLDALRKEVFSC